MKSLFCSLVILILILGTSCTGKGPAKNASSPEADSSFVGDSIVKYYNNKLLMKEVTFKDGVRNGLTRTFYAGGQLYQTFWYVNDMKEDTARWFYLEGQVFRTTPFRHDTVDGIQEQFYRSGKIKAKIGYKKGLRTPFFQEFNTDGKMVTGYPEIVVNVQDLYKTKGLYQVDLVLSDKSTKVKFYRGEFTNDQFDTTKCRLIPSNSGKALLTLRKSGTDQPSYVNIIAEITTPYLNKYLTSKKINLPYKDLK